MAKRTLIVTELSQALRLDKYLSSQQPEQSRSRFEQLIKAGHITVNGKVAKPAYQVLTGDVIEIDEPAPIDDINPRQDVPFTVIFEDEDIIVIDKPSGVVTHPAPGHGSDTLVNGLLSRYPHLSGINGIKRPGIVHRIDKDTSGLLVVARNDKAHRHLALQLADHTMFRQYLALCKGVISESEGMIDAPIGRDTRNRQKMGVNLIHGKNAITHFKVMQRYHEHTLLSLQLETGRTHQIRVHLSYIKHPIVGDNLYGGRDPLYQKGQLLHATKLVLTHPTTNKRMTFETPLPDHFNDVIKQMEQLKR